MPRPVSWNAVSVPSFFAPALRVSVFGGRLPTQRKDSSRLTKQRTGRPVFRARRAAISVYFPGSSLLPNPPPMYLLITRTLVSGIWSDWARPPRMSKTPWFVSQTFSRSPSHFATEPCGSMGVWISQGVRNVLSTTTAASAKPLATSPRSYLSGSPLRLPLSWMAGAPGFSACS